MMMIEDARWKGEEDVDEETLAIYKQLELRDRRRLSTIFRQLLENLNFSVGQVDCCGPEQEPAAFKGGVRRLHPSRGLIV